jgi:hypothetical protein
MYFFIFFIESEQYVIDDTTWCLVQQRHQTNFSYILKYAEWH